MDNHTRYMQCCPTTAVHFGDVCPLIDQVTDDLGSTCGRCPVQRRTTVLGPSVAVEVGE